MECSEAGSLLAAREESFWVNLDVWAVCRLMVDLGLVAASACETIAKSNGNPSLWVERYVCLPQIKPEHIGDAVHPGSDGTECAPLPRRHVISARPCSTISECACHYSSPCRTAAHGADGVRRTPRYDRGIPCGSSRSTVLRMRFAWVNTLGGLECR